MCERIRRSLLKFCHWKSINNGFPLRRVWFKIWKGSYIIIERCRCSGMCKVVASKKSWRWELTLGPHCLEGPLKQIGLDASVVGRRSSVNCQLMSLDRLYGVIIDTWLPSTSVELPLPRSHNKDGITQHTVVCYCCNRETETPQTAIQMKSERSVVSASKRILVLTVMLVTSGGACDTDWISLEHQDHRISWRGTELFLTLCTRWMVASASACAHWETFATAYLAGFSGRNRWIV